MDTLGELVQEWMRQSGLKPGQLARRIGGSVKRQHIAQLVAAGNRRPRYIVELARAMGTTVEALIALEMPPPLPQPATKPVSAPPPVAAPPAAPPKDFRDPASRTVTPSQWALLQDLEVGGATDEELAPIRARAALVRKLAHELNEKTKAAARIAAAGKNVKGSEK